MILPYKFKFLICFISAKPSNNHLFYIDSLEIQYQNCPWNANNWLVNQFSHFILSFPDDFPTFSGVGLLHQDHGGGANHCTLQTMQNWGLQADSGINFRNAASLESLSSIPVCHHDEERCQSQTRQEACCKCSYVVI